MSFIDPDYVPSKKDLVCTFFVRTKKEIESVLDQIAGESSIGTWTEITTMKPEITERLSPHVFGIENNIAKIAYPLELFEADSIPNILSSIAGNIFGMKVLDRLKLIDIEFPEEMVNMFRGPKFGIDGIKKIYGIERPVVGTIVKPKVGLKSEEHAKVAYEAWLGGCDFVKDDENLTNQAFNPFHDRIEEVMKMKEKAENETGEKKIYAPNITAPFERMMERAEFVSDMDGKCVMVDVITVGFSALQQIREVTEDLGLFIHAHRAMHAALTRSDDFGVSMLVIAKLMRLIGTDQLHIGTVIGKMEGDKKEVDDIKNAITGDFFDLKPVLPVCSGGLHPGHIPKLIEMMGNDFVIQMGGGIHGHPKGTISGAKAARQAVDAAMCGSPLKEYAKNHEELRIALERWKA